MHVWVENAHLAAGNNNEVIHKVTRIINDIRKIKFSFGKHDFDSLSRSRRKQLPQLKLV